jgi:hypothetical protein
MATDPSIYAQYLRPPKSVAEFDREAYGADHARYGSQAAQLELLAGRRKLDAMDRQASQSARLQALIRGAGSEAGALEALRGAGEYAAAGEMESSMLGRQKDRAEVQSKAASTTKAFGEAQDAALKRYRGALDFVDTPQGVARWLQAQYADPLLTEHMQALGPLDQALQRLPQDPAGLQQWRQQAALGMDRWMEQQRLQAVDAERARSNKAGEDLTRRGQDVTKRGQDLTDDRARDLNTITKAEKEQTRKTEQTDKAVTKYADTLQKEGIPELETAVSGVENVLKLYDTTGPDGKTVVGDAPGVGRLAGALPAFMLSEEGNNLRQAVAQVRNIVLSARSGAAVTDQELRRLVEELGTGMGQSEESLRTGLQRVRERLEAIKTNAAAGVSDDVRRVYEDRGGIKTKPRANSAPANAGLTRTPLTGPAAPGGGTAIDDLLKKYGQ